MIIGAEKINCRLYCSSFSINVLDFELIHGKKLETKIFSVLCEISIHWWCPWTYCQWDEFVNFCNSFLSYCVTLPCYSNQIVHLPCTLGESNIGKLIKFCHISDVFYLSDLIFHCHFSDVKLPVFFILPRVSNVIWVIYGSSVAINPYIVSLIKKLDWKCLSKVWHLLLVWF